MLPAICLFCHTVACIRCADSCCSQVTTETQLRGERKEVCLKLTLLPSQKQRVCIFFASELKKNIGGKKSPDSACRQSRGSSLRSPTTMSVMRVRTRRGRGVGVGVSATSYAFIRHEVMFPGRHTSVRRNDAPKW